MQSFLKVRVACWDLDEKAAVQVVCELEELGGTGLPIKVIFISINGNSHNSFNNSNEFFKSS